jgi:two-component system phosphate regulon sensor histidine kinase PhoR
MSWFDWSLLVTLLVLFVWNRRMRLQLIECSAQRRRLEQQQSSLESRMVRRGERLDALFSAVSEVVMRVDRAGRVVAINARTRELFALRQELDFPISMLSFYRTPGWNRAFGEALKRLPESSKLPEMFVDEHVLAPRLAPLGGDQALLLCMDVTEQYRLQQQRKRFLANLMHDLKTPLTSMLGYARSIEAFDHDADLRKEAARVIADEAQHVNRLLDALLTLDQIEFDQHQNRSCDVVVACHRVLDTVAPLAEEKGVEIEVALPDSAMVGLEESDCYRIVRNVVENGLLHSPAKRSMSIRWLNEDEGNSLVIEDQGPGIPEAHLPHVSERFYRIDASRQRGGSAPGGHGLGLAIVRETLERDGGELRLENREEGGLRVSMLMPAAQA